MLVPSVCSYLSVSVQQHINRFFDRLNFNEVQLDNFRTFLVVCDCLCYELVQREVGFYFLLKYDWYTISFFIALYMCSQHNVSCDSFYFAFIHIKKNYPSKWLQSYALFKYANLLLYASSSNAFVLMSCFHVISARFALSQMPILSNAKIATVNVLDILNW